MSRLGTMFQIESAKIWKRRMSLVFVVIIALMAVFVNGASWYVVKVMLPDLERRMAEMDPDGGVNIEFEVPGGAGPADLTYGQKRAELVEQVALAKAALDRNDPSASDASYQNLRASLDVINYKLDRGLVAADEPVVSDQASAESSAWQQMASGSTSAGAMVLTFALVFMAIVLAGEFEKGTMKSLIIRPVSRTTILFAKYFAVFVFALVAQVVNYLVNLVVGGLLFGFGDPTAPVIVGLMGGVLNLPAWAFSILFYLLEWVAMLFPLAITTFIAVATRANAGSIAISLVILYLINPLASQLGGYLPALRFTPFVNMSFVQYFTQGITINHTNLGFTALVWLGYTVLCLVGALLVFRKRDV